MSDPTHGFLREYAERYGEPTGVPGTYRFAIAPTVRYALPKRAFQMDGESGGIGGIALTYGELISGYEEVVRAGAFEDGAHVRLLRGHERALPALGTVELAEVDGVYRFAGEWLATEWAQDGREETKQLMDRLGGIDTSLGFTVEEYAFDEGLTPGEKAVGAMGAIIAGTPKELSLVIDGAAPSAMVERVAHSAPVEAVPEPEVGLSAGASVRLIKARADRRMAERRNGVRR